MFRLLTWPYLKRHALRFLLVVCGVALAVGVYVSMRQANNAIQEAFQAVAETLAGSAQLQVTGGEAGVPEEALDRTRQAGCVEAAAAVILRTVSTGSRGEGGLAVLGVDLLEDHRFREYRVDGRNLSGPDDALVFFAQPDSVLLTRDFTARNRLASGAQLRIWTGREEKTLTVRGVLDSAGPARAYGGNIAVMDVYAAQHMFGRRGYFDRIDVAVREGGRVDACRAALAGRMGPHLKVEPPASRGRRTEAFSRSYLFLVKTAALLGLLVSMFLVHHASATAVAQREREIAIVRGLGGDEDSIQRMVLLESLALGALGGAAGIGIAAFAATRLSAVLARLLEMAYGLSVTASSAPIDWRHAAATVVGAAVFCALSGLGPARSAASIAPIQLMEAPRYNALVERPSRAWIALATVSAAAGLLWQAVDRRPEVLFVALPLLAIALGLWGRALSSLALRALRPLFAAVWPMEGTPAIDSLLRSNRRTRGTVLGLSATVAAFLAISGLTAGYADSFRLWARQLVNADFLIHSSANLAARGEMFPLALRDSLRAVPEVAAVLPIRRLSAEVEGLPAKVIGIDLALWKKYGGADIPSSTDGAIISRNFARFSGRRAGDSIRIAAPDGSFHLPVRAVIDDFTDEKGTVWLDWRMFRDRFHDDSVEMFAIRLRAGASRARARQGLLREFPPGAPVLILDGEQFRGYLDRLVNQWRAISYIQVVAAMLIALVGIGSFLVVSIVERRRELGLMVVLGATPGQLARCVLVEALGVAAAGLLLGAPWGMLLQLYLLFTLRYSITGFDLPWRLDTPLAAALLVAVPVAALLAAALPLRGLNRMNLAREVERDA